MRTVQNQKKITLSNWHPADIKGSLEKRGWTLRRLGAAHGYAAGSAKKALHKPWPKMEGIIAQAIGLPPWAIWPSRYDDQGRPNRAIGRPRLRSVK